MILMLYVLIHDPDLRCKMAKKAIDCHSTEHLGCGERRRTQEPIHTSTMGELVCFRPELPLVLARGEYSTAEGGLENHGTESGTR
jgi:hypothetical protein